MKPTAHSSSRRYSTAWSKIRVPPPSLAVMNTQSASGNTYSAARSEVAPGTFLHSKHV